VLAALSAHLAASLSGQGGVVFLHGEAGVGKSSVLERFAESAAATADVLRGWCDPLSTPRPLGPWADVAPDLGAAVDTELDGGSGEVSGLLRAVLAALASRPRVLIFEDLHWADKATLDMLRLLARRIARLPTLLVASYRDDELGSRHPMRLLLGDVAGSPAVHRYPIEPLSPGGVAQLATGRGLDVAQLHRVTGGNPFFVTEVLGAGGEAIPATVGDAVAGRISRLSVAAYRTAQVVAVIGSPAPFGMVADLAADAALDELVDSGVLVALEGGVGFRHELARMAVLGATPAHSRAALHAQVLALLQADPVRGEDAALLAHHADAAGDTAGVLEHAPRAAERAAASGAHREAAAHCARALRFGTTLPLPVRADLLERFARASQMADQLAEALDALRDAVELWRRCGQPLREGFALRLLSGLSVPACRTAEARHAGERAVQVLETISPSPELASAYVNMAELAAFGQLGAATTAQYARRAETLGEGFGYREAVLQARFALGLARYFSDDAGESPSGWDEMERAHVEALEAGFTDPAAFMTMMQAVCAPLHRDHDRADVAYRRLDVLAHERDLQLYLRFGSAHRTLSLLHRGSWDEATELATSLLSRPGAPQLARIAPLLVLGLVRARRGDPDAAEPLDDALRSVDSWFLPAAVCAARAEAAWLEGNRDRILGETCRGLEATTLTSDPWATGEMARWEAIGGKQPSPARIAEPFALEIAGDWRAAAATWERLGCPYDAALARLGGDVPALLSALETFESLGARPAADRARVRLKSLGVRSGLRGPRASTRINPHGLTSRQLEILDLVADGLTDAQIAARLHLSAKTVNHHVGAVLTKLDVHTRADAVGRLAGSR
jgi:DNA-binding CsgD family transcriptional regulator